MLEIDPLEPKLFVLENHFIPREEDGEAPLDSSLWNVEIRSIDVSDPTPMTIQYIGMK